MLEVSADSVLVEGFIDDSRLRLRSVENKRFYSFRWREYLVKMGIVLVGSTRPITMSLNPE